MAPGVAIYAPATRAKDKQGAWGFWILVLLLLIAYLGSSFSGPPPSVKALWITAMVGTLVTLALRLCVVLAGGRVYFHGGTLSCRDR